MKTLLKLLGLETYELTPLEKRALDKANAFEMLSGKVLI